MISVNQVQTQALSMLRDLISIPSVNPGLTAEGNGEGEIASYLASYLADLGLTVHRQLISPGRENIIGVWKGLGNGPSLMLNGHTDTVAVDGMEIPPFEPKVDGNRVYGRGAIDMKSGITAQIMAVKSLIDQGKSLKGDVIIACVADEEYASLGTQKLLEDFHADAAIVTEPTNLNLVTAHKGFVWSNIKVRGKAAHGSNPDEGVDAIVKTGHILLALEAWDSQHLSFKRHPLLGRGSVHASLIQGGSGMSTYPDYCLLELERRTIPGETKEMVHKELNDLLQNIRTKDIEIDADLNTYLERKALEIDPEQAIVQSLMKANQIRCGRTCEPAGVSFWTDAALLAEAGIPSVVFGPKGKGLHAAVEYVEFDSVMVCAEILAETIADYCELA